MTGSPGILLTPSFQVASTATFVSSRYRITAWLNRLSLKKPRLPYCKRAPVRKAVASDQQGDSPLIPQSTLRSMIPSGNSILNATHAQFAALVVPYDAIALAISRRLRIQERLGQVEPAPVAALTRAESVSLLRCSKASAVLRSDTLVAGSVSGPMTGSMTDRTARAGTDRRTGTGAHPGTARRARAY